jgi:hypothetical protein
VALYEDADLAIDLPEPWKVVSTKPDQLVFTTPGRQLTVSILNFGRQPDDLAAAVGRLYELRLTAERKGLSPNDVLNVGQLKRTPDQRLVGVFSGVVRATGRTFSALVVGSTKFFVSSYFESTIGDFREHATLTPKVLGGVVLKAGR